MVILMIMAEFVVLLKGDVGLRYLLNLKKTPSHRRRDELHPLLHCTPSTTCHSLITLTMINRGLLVLIASEANR